MYYIYGRVRAIPTYRVYRLYDNYITIHAYLNCTRVTVVVLFYYVTLMLFISHITIRVCIVIIVLNCFHIPVYNYYVLIIIEHYYFVILFVILMYMCKCMHACVRMHVNNSIYIM